MKTITLLKKISALFVSLCITSTMMAGITIPASATSEPTAWEYTISLGKVSIEGYTGTQTEITIPSTIEGYPVTYIAGSAFKGNKSITSVVIPDSVTSIGGQAFSNCSNLANVTIPNSVTVIANYVFLGCSNLVSINIPEDVTSIGAYAFSGCSNLVSINIPEDVTSIGACAFSGCSSLTSIYVDSRNKNYCSLNDVLFNKEIKELIKYPARNTNSNYNVPNSVTIICDYAFEGCSNLTSISIPDNVTSIGTCAFKNCSNLVSINIPENITKINRSTFDGCSSLTSITIPKNIISIDDSAFFACDSLTSVYITDIVAWCNIKFETYPSNPLYYAKNLYINGTLATDIIIPNSITSIDKYAFYYCSSITTVIISDSVTSIGYGSFGSCINLTSITIGSGVTSIANNAFDGCNSLTSIIVDPENNYYDSRENCNAIIETSTNTLIKGSNKAIIPNSITSIGSGAFAGCRNLTSITIPDSVISIGGSAFVGCSGLISITIPDSVTSIGGQAFSNCNNLLYIVYCNTKEQWKNIKIGFNAIPGNISIKYHDYESVKVAPTKTESGYTLHTCTECGDTKYTDVVMPKSNIVQNVTTSSNSDKVTVTWNALTGVSKYIAYLYAMDGTLVKCNQTTTNRLVFSGIAEGDYVVLVIAKTSKGWSRFYDADEVPVTVSYENKITSPIVSISKIDKDSAVFVWDAVEGATKYVVRVVGNGETIYRSATSTYVKLGNLVPGVEYKVSVNAKTTDGYLGYSEVTIFETAQPTVILSYDESAGKIFWHSKNADTQPDKVWIKKVNADGTEKQIKVLSGKDSFDCSKISGDVCVIARVKVNGASKYIKSNIVSL